MVNKIKFSGCGDPSFTPAVKVCKLSWEDDIVDSIYHCYAGAAFGMEGLVSKELKQAGADGVASENGGVGFSASGEKLFALNMNMRFSDRLYIVLASESCRTFEELFNLVHGIDWAPFFSGNESIDVSCKCTRSMLMSPRDCQSVTKKAIIRKIQNATGQSVFPETGTSLPVHLTIRNDRAMILLNTSGQALSRRGYRTWNGEAPLRETLAAALVELSGWKSGQPLHDPCCGTGTILAEAALHAAGIAPGLHRSFSMEQFPCFGDIPFASIRKQAESVCDMDRAAQISGSDIDREALELARRHLIQAGFPEGKIPLEQIPLQELKLSADNGVFICNPPYGERLGDQEYCRKLYRDLYCLWKRHLGWRMCAISSDPAFERSFGKRADKKRRLYNGRLECVFYVYD